MPYTLSPREQLAKTIRELEIEDLMESESNSDREEDILLLHDLYTKRYLVHRQAGRQVVMQVFGWAGRAWRVRVSLLGQGRLAGRQALGSAVRAGARRDQAGKYAGFFGAGQARWAGQQAGGQVGRAGVWFVRAGSARRDQAGRQGKEGQARWGGNDRSSLLIDRECFYRSIEHSLLIDRGEEEAGRQAEQPGLSLAFLGWVLGRWGRPGLGSALLGWVLGRWGRPGLGLALLGWGRLAGRLGRWGRPGLGLALLGWVLGRWGRPGLCSALLGWVLGRWGSQGQAGAWLGFAGLGPRQVGQSRAGRQAGWAGRVGRGLARLCWAGS
ncbi:hypothetical protein PPACK8108_LOCUS1324 [Phakopsora pachyrhizi]|uniref:Uncharacterized protein n=1 Tax=Phakopsora pachyrhizi TaxID=170000 RepID=A0AAV0AG80_PHAPC|nr:hypothetical protein PPACK8108_LOCUS1324 [Phakopsora pachyrhizi]